MACRLTNINNFFADFFYLTRNKNIKMSFGGIVKQGNLRYGSKASVYHGFADLTTGGLDAKDLTKNRRGKIVYRKKHEAALKRFEKGQPFNKYISASIAMKHGAPRLKHPANSTQKWHVTSAKKSKKKKGGTLLGGWGWQ